jgi:hypothetical protein
LYSPSYKPRFSLSSSLLLLLIHSPQLHSTPALLMHPGPTYTS